VSAFNTSLLLCVLWFTSGCLAPVLRPSPPATSMAVSTGDLSGEVGSEGTPLGCRLEPALLSIAPGLSAMLEIHHDRGDGSLEKVVVAETDAPETSTIHRVTRRGVRITGGETGGSATVTVRLEDGARCSALVWNAGMSDDPTMLVAEQPRSSSQRFQTPRSSGADLAVAMGGGVLLAPSVTSAPRILGVERSEVEMATSMANSEDRESIELLVTGAEFYPRRLEMIRNARHSIDLVTFLWCSDRSGMQIARELVAARARGVTVRVLVDYFNFKQPDPVYRTLAEGGIRPLIFNPPRWGWRLNHRVHEKMMVVDGESALVGGANLCDEYMIDDHEQLWDDYEVFARGALVEQIQYEIHETWNYAAQIENQARAAFRHRRQPRRSHSIDREGDQLGRPWHALVDVASPGVEHTRLNTASVFLYQRPYRVSDDPDRYEAFFERLIGIAEQQLVVYAPYLIPSDRFENALLQARRRGVEVIVFTNSAETNDIGWSHVTAARSHYERLLSHGVRLYEADGTTLHGKAVLVDDRIATVGSHNFTRRSFRHNGEANILTMDRRVILRLQMLAQRDMTRYGEVTQEDSECLMSGVGRWMGRFF
jgi:phosphatidylserine/phosphatidylglycerophosphate/cardiolipin synthase-like enzyme